MSSLPGGFEMHPHLVVYACLSWGGVAELSCNVAVSGVVGGVLLCCCPFLGSGFQLWSSATVDTFCSVVLNDEGSWFHRRSDNCPSLPSLSLVVIDVDWLTWLKWLWCQSSSLIVVECLWLLSLVQLFLCLTGSVADTYSDTYTLGHW